MVWYAQSCCRQLGGTAKGNVKPTDAGKSLAATQLEHVEVCQGGVFACSKNVNNESAETRSKSCREPFHVERGGNLVQTRMQCALRGVCHRIKYHRGRCEANRAPEEPSNDPARAC